MRSGFPFLGVQLQDLFVPCKHQGTEHSRPPLGHRSSSRVALYLVSETIEKVRPAWLQPKTTKNSDYHRHTVDSQNPASHFDIHMSCSTITIYRYIYIYIHVMCMYIYIYRERERERDYICISVKNSPVITVLQQVSTING